MKEDCPLCYVENLLEKSQSRSKLLNKQLRSARKIIKLYADSMNYDPWHDGSESAYKWLEENKELDD